MAPKDVHVLIPRTCEHGMLYGEGAIKIADGIKLANQWILRWRDYSRSSKYLPNVITRIFISGKGRQKSQN